jgi:hypothetical protein
VTEHLSTQSLEQYRRRTMSPTEILAADDHLASCEVCRRLALKRDQVDTVISRLRLNLREGASFESDHATYEQIVALVDGEIDDTSRDTLEHHLESCAFCTEDVNDLRLVRSEVLASSVKEAMPNTRPTFRQKITAFTDAIRLSLRPALAAALALLFISISIALFFAWKAMRRESPQRAGGVEPPGVPAPASPGSSPETLTQPSTTEPPEIVLALNDSSGRVALNKTGNLEGLGLVSPSAQQAVKQALTTERVEVPQMSELIGKKSTLLGTQQGETFSLSSPVGTVTRNVRPTLRWRQLSGATSYKVSVLDADFNAVATSPSLTTISWTPSRALERGRVYSWQVTALKDGEEIISPSAPAPEARFKVLEKSKADELNELERNSNSHLTRGVLYARAGLLDDAERELRALLAANPDSQVARKLLQSVAANRK